MKGIVEVVLVVVLMLAAPVVASINVGVIGVDGTTNNVRDVTGYATHGDDMDGMTVTAFIDGVAEPSVPWVTSGVDSGEAIGNGWSLTQNGDTFDNPWTLIVSETISLTRLLFDALEGNTVFDRTTPDPAYVHSTPGSSHGLDFDVTYSSVENVDIDATYINQVAVGGNPPVGDLYRNLDVSFSAPLSGQTVQFMADTDNIRRRRRGGGGGGGGGCHEPPDTPVPVPEPATIAIWSVLGLCCLGRKLRFV